MINVPESSSPVHATAPFQRVVQDVAARAIEALPLANGRVHKAVQIVLTGGVKQTDHGWVVQSQSQPDVKWAVNGVCACPDAESAPHGGLCKHRIAVALHRRALEALMQEQALGDDVPGLEPEPTPQGIRPEWLVSIQGKRFIKFAGLLQMAHERGLSSLTAEWTYNDGGLSLAQAVAVFPFGRFEECGDATPENVTKKVAPHFRRVALTRAKSRVLRDALNVDLVAVEELADE